jgi:hypothetical protein
LKRSTIWKLRRSAGLALVLSILCALGSICLFVIELLRWMITGLIQPITIGHLIGIDGFWGRLPLWIVGPALSVLMLVLFFETWSFAVRKDMAVDAARGRAECGEDVQDGMI